MKHLKTAKVALLGLVTIGLISCSSDDDPDYVNEEEVITTLKVTLTPQNGRNTNIIVLESKDSDGDGPLEPEVTISSGLTAGVTYNGTVEFWNDLEDPSENITEEISEEAEEHQVFFSATNNIATMAYLASDQDANGNPIGLDFTLTAASATATGNITVTLLHEPNKDAEGVSSGDMTSAGGETDIQVTFTGVSVNQS